ncbi:GntR family transcriptional regulator [Clavibacter phaseoli]|nr:GntR family transcriptional regulator [Clavibacter phaseoli]
MPPYEQIRRQYVHLIQQGALLSGTRLPTVRRLAGDLGLAVNTVARAYKQLEIDGFVATRGRAGTVVAAASNGGRNPAHEAAVVFASTMARLGVTRDEALQLAGAAIDARNHSEGVR